ncbi:MAG: hypothetical protein KAJ62_05775 [Desulfobacteraceae bacterium]|nr:hypothetical protein [Desulfobacteraceae bacterium]
MNNRLFPALIIVFILLAGMIIYIDIQPLSPKKKLEIPDVKEVRMHENNQLISDIDVYFNTKETIKKRGKLEEKIAPDNYLYTEQNPFLFPEEILLLKFGKENFSEQELADIGNKIVDDKETGTTSSGSRFHLSMIMMGQNQKFALVNQKFVIEGDNVEDFKVEKISKKSITLVNKEEIKEIQLEPDFVPLMHKSSNVQIDLPEENQVEQEVEPSDGAGNLKKQLQDVLRMYE